MQRVLVVVALCVGCYSPSITPGAPCETACPGGLVCIDLVCREPGYMPAIDAGLQDAFVPIDTVDGAPGDGDGDGVADPSDNCPALTNADQHDEDADALGDVCDPCPHLAGSSADGDGDGVGDACDPQPTIGKQRIKFFDPFTTDRAEWTSKSNFSRVGEALRLSAAGYAGSVLQLANAENRIVMAGTIAAIPSATSQHQIALSFGRNVAGNVYHYAEFYDAGGANGEVGLSRANQGVYTTLASSNYTGVLPLGAWSIRVDTSVASQQMRMDSTLGGTARPTLNATATSPALVASSTIELGVNGADVRVSYFLVIETLP